MSWISHSNVTWTGQQDFITQHPKLIKDAFRVGVYPVTRHPIVRAEMLQADGLNDVEKRWIRLLQEGSRPTVLSPEIRAIESNAFLIVPLGSCYLFRRQRLLI